MMRCFPVYSQRLVLLMITVAGCRSLDRAYADSSLLVAQLSIKNSVKNQVPLGTLSIDSSGGVQSPEILLLTVAMRVLDLNPVPDPALYIIRLPEESSRPMASSHMKDELFVFSNVSAGNYRIVDLWIPGSGGGSAAESYGRMRTGNTIVVPWENEMAELSVTEGLPGIVNFLGEYDVLIGSRELQEVKGEKNAEKEERALNRVLEKWSGQWPEQGRLQMQAAY